MSLTKVKPGDPLSIPASTFNTFVDAASDFLSRRHDQGQKATPSSRLQAGVIFVRNDSGADRSRFDVLGVSAPIFNPSSDEDAFKNQPALSGTTPSKDNHAGKFVVLLEPIAAGQIGMACAGGVCSVHIYVEDETHRLADVNDGQAGSLRTSPTGSATILWKEAGTGQRWAVVRLGNPVPAAQAFPSNARKKQFMVVQLSADNNTDNDDPSLWTIDYIRAHA